MTVDYATPIATPDVRRRHALPPWELYQAWQAAFADADAALRDWSRAPVPARAAAYAAYRAAADREDAAAALWLAC